MANKERDKHEFYNTTIRITDYMVDMAIEASDLYGRNKNNQKTISHAIHALILNFAESLTNKDQSKLYPEINYKP